MVRIYWILAAIAAAMAGAVAAKLHSRSTAMCANVPCSYLQIRLGVIDQMIARANTPAYLIIGDSLTEIGSWPTLCGHAPVPAGISGALSDTWLPHAKAVADRLKPEFVVLALGTNDVLMLGRLGAYEPLAASLSAYRLIAVPIHNLPTARPGTVQDANVRIAKAVANTTDTISAATTDGVHLTAGDYAQWFRAIEKVACGGR